jgi:hypothetical protein
VKLFSCAFVAPSFHSSVLFSGIIGQPGRESERRLHEIWRFGLGLGLVILSLNHDEVGITGTSATMACRSNNS